jgi:glycosyltransferase involved in cell wall biosynthesis
MALVYAAADVFLAPSLEDNLPNTVLEALSCGTPVVAFNIGGMPDMVTHRANGYLAPGFDTDQLAQGLHWVLEDLSRWESLSAAARETVLDTFTLQHAASRYYALYRELLGVA